jgi:putative FmdB family regulatory protein
MPTYEYRCGACGTEFEKIGRMSDPPVEACPSCGADAERRLSAGAGLLFRGSGFYITDYRGESYRKAAAADGGGEAAAKKPDAGKGDAKPAPGPTPPASGGAKGE